MTSRNPPTPAKAGADFSFTDDIGLMTWATPDRAVVTLGTDADMAAN